MYVHVQTKGHTKLYCHPLPNNISVTSEGTGTLVQWLKLSAKSEPALALKFHETKMFFRRSHVKINIVGRLIQLVH